ncbi:reverse transcriptase domain-containing protein [Acetobacter syzygii]|uniref:reverse transcriptase domain-containing protein n=1 Tax=Acetobacter syzygii TaxID=146476 RepID=UPI0039EB446D
MGSSALVELGKISNLEKVWDDFWRRTRGKTTPGIDDVSPILFREQKRSRLQSIHHDLRDGYQFSALRGVAVPKTDPSKLRLICVPTVADRIVQRALLKVLEKQSRKLGILNEVSYGFVRDTNGSERGVHGAHKAASKLRDENPWVFKADISKFFDTIDRKDLSTRFCRAFHQKSLAPLFLGAINCEVLARGDRTKIAISQNNITPGVGLRQGMPLSPVLSNFVLRDFDKNISSKYPMVRYADDLIVFTKTEALCIESKVLVERELEKLDLKLSAEKSYVRGPEEPVEFLGMQLTVNKSGKYELIISEDQMKEIRGNIRKYHDLSFLKSREINAQKLFKRLELMRSGYLSAYAYAANRDKFEHRLAQWIQRCSYKVYTSIFGQEAVDNLTDEQKTFLMLI